MADPEEKKQSAWPFSAMVSMPWPFMVLLPVAFAFLVGFGWSQDDYIEDEVTEIWIPTSGDYAQDTKYAEDLGRARLPATSMAAMAIARDGGNLFTEPRLEEIRQRMEKAESTTVEWKGQTINWDDVCVLNNAGKGTVYEFPCFRFSPMDLFQEARWFFDETDKLTWYNDVIGDRLLKPRIPRFGIMRQNCPSQCFEVMQLRQNATFALSQGYPIEYVNPLGLFDDIGSMEMNHPCRACIETAFEATMTSLTSYVKGAFGVLALEMGRFLQSGQVTDPNDQLELQRRAQQYGLMSVNTTREDVEEFYTILTIRGLYAQLGAGDYAAGYAQVAGALLPGCQASTDGLVCPPATVDAATASFHLVTHADSDFSSVNTAGSPFPFWPNSDGTGNLFEGTSPTSGSGVNLSGDLFSLRTYLDLTNVQNPPEWNPGYSNGFADPITPDPAWTANVESNPVYKWFMSGLEVADNKCANSVLKGTSTSDPQYDGLTAAVIGSPAVSSSWCTKYNVPNDEDAGQGPYTTQHFARMWYQLLIDSDQFLGMTQGEDDPYTWTTGSGCGYSLGGERDPYTGQNDTTIRTRASRDLYYVDEGLSLGPVDRHLLLGNVEPTIEDYSFSNPITTVGVLQSLYFGLQPEDIVDRVKNCNRPGGPIDDMTKADAESILETFKEKFESNWVEGWDDENAGEVQFVLFSDDTGAVGTTARTLREITLDNSKLMSISIILIALFSVVLLVSPDWIESRVLVTLIGVSLVVLAFFASLGLAILIGIKINVTTAWTLPFIILGIGVDDVYIVLMALKSRKGYSESNFLETMKEVAVPVSMTSIVNCLMFAVMNISDIPAIYHTATVATICIIALYLSVLFCFPAYCWMDMRRQAAGYRDVFFCFKAKERESDKPLGDDARHVWLYDKFYKRMMFGHAFTGIVHTFFVLGALALLGTGIYGITEREIGLGLEDFFPENSQAYRWASVRTEALASWSIGMNWGALNYSNPDTQMKMIKQFEDVLATPHVSDTDTRFLWMADFLIWTTKHCTDNFDRSDPDFLECGMNQVYAGDGTTCTGTWISNTQDLRNKNFPDPRGECEPFEGGICRPTNEMFAEDLPPGFDLSDNKTSWCPVAGWSDDKFKWCLTQWRNITDFSGGRFVFDSETATATQCSGEFYRDEELTYPMPFSSGPTMFAFDLFSHEITLDLLEQTRAVCDDDGELHCWMTGIPYDYWTQYEDIFKVLMQLSFVSAAVGFGVAWIFLLGTLLAERRHSFTKIVLGSFTGSALITLSILTSLIAVIGLSVLADVSMTGFSNMAFVLSVGFAVEYSVHIVSRWLLAPENMTAGADRVEHTMSFLMLPTFMSWVSSTIGVVCLAFTEFHFTNVFFFRPLIIVMMVTYFVGCYSLPSLLVHIEFDVCRLGAPEESASVEDLSSDPEEPQGDEGLLDEDKGVEQEAAPEEETAEDAEETVGKDEPLQSEALQQDEVVNDDEDKPASSARD